MMQILLIICIIPPLFTWDIGCPMRLRMTLVSSSGTQNFPFAENESESTLPNFILLRIYKAPGADLHCRFSVLLQMITPAGT